MPMSAAATGTSRRRRVIGYWAVKWKLTWTGRFDLAEGVLDQPRVVFLRHTPLQDLRRDRHRKIDRLRADLLQRSRGFHLDALLRILDDGGRVGLRLLLHLVAKTVGVLARALQDRVGLRPRVGEHLRRFAAQPLQFF